MNIINIINEEISTLIDEEKIWYHGSVDIRTLNDNSFAPRTDSTTVISDPKKWVELQNEMKNAREVGNNDYYFKLLDIAGGLRKPITYKKPIFFTDQHSVARTYATDKKAFDYQNSIPKTINVAIDDSGKVLKIPAYGDRFRGIDVDKVKNALKNEGIPENIINQTIGMFQDQIIGGGNKLSTDDLAIIAQILGFDIIDVIGVLDSYHGGTIKSTVRMVFNPNRIKIIH